MIFMQRGVHSCVSDIVRIKSNDPRLSKGGNAAGLVRKIQESAIEVGRTGSSAKSAHTAQKRKRCYMCNNDYKYFDICSLCNKTICKTRTKSTCLNCPNLIFFSFLTEPWVDFVFFFLNICQNEQHSEICTTFVIPLVNLLCTHISTTRHRRKYDFPYKSIRGSISTQGTLKVRNLRDGLVLINLCFCFEKVS